MNYIKAACAKNEDAFLFYRLANIFNVYLIDMEDWAFEVYDDMSWFDFLRNNGSISEIINQKYSPVLLASLALIAT